eukprot:CAMPEP_0177665274 /NCGR_PEP_ID=MMETSP0447-20121125/20965_1 /TAXON_ID=0 /ORGANISM="Stygamoeba regulata, Strain BSH-02190019" /LENGTH=286 /DNA_ID=CAMNT_0019171353 /DNA_START=32 /DNA_END=892 /DNA_ORIENTATION=-
MLAYLLGREDFLAHHHHSAGDAAQHTPPAETVERTVTNASQPLFDDVDEPTDDGTTPLHLACYGAHIEAVEFLVAAGADLYRRNSFACGAEHFAALAEQKNTSAWCAAECRAAEDDPAQAHAAVRSTSSHSPCLLGVDPTRSDSVDPLRVDPTTSGSVDPTNSDSPDPTSSDSVDSLSDSSRDPLSQSSAPFDEERHRAMRSVRMCAWLAAHGLRFDSLQKEGHSPAHKAAQHLNGSVLRWMADSGVLSAAACAPDLRGLRPSDIWASCGGDERTAAWLRQLESAQ